MCLFYPSCWFQDHNSFFELLLKSIKRRSLNNYMIEYILTMSVRQIVLHSAIKPNLVLSSSYLFQKYKYFQYMWLYIKLLIINSPYYFLISIHFSDTKCQKMSCRSQAQKKCRNTKSNLIVAQVFLFGSIRWYFWKSCSCFYSQWCDIGWHWIWKQEYETTLLLEVF